MYPFSVTSSSVEGKLECPECKLEYTEEGVLLNPFVSKQKTEDKKDEPEEKEEKDEKDDKICTSCDENEAASSFCVECAEWLCDPCVIAHKRVKLTKDHSVKPKSEAQDIQVKQVDELKPKQMHCQVHKTELLKLFCLTCEKLTCRDCQLEDHKDHNYQYIEKTVDEQKQVLLDGIAKVKEKLEKHQEVAEQILNKEKDIKRQQVEVFNEVRSVADMITNELISWCKKLLNFLQGVCHGRLKDLMFKKKEVDTYASKAKYIIDFVQQALDSGDDLALLHAKSVMLKNLTQLQDQDINFSRTLLELNIKYENDAVFLTKNVSKMGFINVNGKSYPHDESQNTDKEETAKPDKEKAASSPTNNTTATKSVKNMTNGELLNTINKDNFQQHIIELLSREPQNVREQYRSLPPEQKRSFLEKLLATHRQRQQQTGLPNQSNDVVPTANVVVSNGQQMRRTGSFTSDSNALQAMYRQTQSMQQPVQPPYLQPQPQHQQQQQQQQHQIQHQIQQARNRLMQQRQIQHQQVAQQRQLQQQHHQQQQMRQQQMGMMDMFNKNQFGQQNQAAQLQGFQNWRGESTCIFLCFLFLSVMYG